MPERVIAGADGVSLALTDSGSGTPVVLLHGLTATRRYVVMGSRSIERAAHRVIAYDARGHGASSPAPDPGEYGYGALAGDLRHALDELGIERATLVGASMGAHTALSFALTNPGRVTALALITPAYDPEMPADPISLARWDALASGLRAGGPAGFISAYGEPRVDARWRDAIQTAMRQRLGAHLHPEAVADALSSVPRSRPFLGWEQLASVPVPVLVVASRDEADPGHPLAVARRYAEALPDARVVVEERGRSPLAWQGGQLSRHVLELISSSEAG